MVLTQPIQIDQKQGGNSPVYLQRFERYELDVESFGVNAPSSSEVICVGVALSIEDQVGRLGVVTERYGAEGYLEGIARLPLPEQFTLENILSPDGLEILSMKLAPSDYEDFLEHGALFITEDGPLYLDKYNWSSIPIVAVSLDDEGRKIFLASARIILRSNGDNGISLPIFDDPSIKLYSDERLLDDGIDPGDVKFARAEFSQFAKGRHIRGVHRNAANGILRASYQVSNALGIDTWLATIDRKVVRLLNGFYIFQLPKLGDPVRYLGSVCEPVLIVTESALTNASDSPEANDTSRAIAAFIRAESCEGPRWYQGA